MIPTPAWPIDAVMRQYHDLGREVGLPWDVLGGGRSHAPKWHAFDITEHVRRTVVIARAVVGAGWASDSLVTAAAWHDIGKVIAVQFEADGPQFHDHEEAGAAYLAGSNFPAELVDAVRSHGQLRRVNESLGASASRLWLALEMCDEFAKWTDSHFPPEGTERTRHKRDDIVRKLIAASVHPDAVAVAARTGQRIDTEGSL